MIAKATTISHGGNALRYSVNKDRADIVKVNFLPDDISAEAMYQRMMLHQKQFAPMVNHGHPLKRNVIRMEVSPTKEESEGWTSDDWARLAEEYIRAFDSIDLSKRTKRAAAKSTNVRNSQYVVALHRDAKSGIPHLHIDVNRVDMAGHVNDDHLIAERAMAAAHIINERRGWNLPEKISKRRRQQIANTCMAVLRTLPQFSWSDYVAGLKVLGYDIRLQRDSKGIVRGYSVLVGNSAYKSSELGKGRLLMPSKIATTWARIHGEQHGEQRALERLKQLEQQDSKTNGNTQTKEPASRPTSVVMHYDIATDEYHHYHVPIPEAADEIIRKECAIPQDNPFASIEDVQKTALLLFAGYIDGASSMSASGGGGGSDMSGWGRDKDEDDLAWARRCARMANNMCKRRRGLHR